MNKDIEDLIFQLEELNLEKNKADTDDEKELELELEKLIYTNESQHPKMEIGEIGGSEAKRPRYDDPGASSSRPKIYNRDYRYENERTRFQEDVGYNYLPGKKGFVPKDRAHKIRKWSEQFEPKMTEEKPIPPNGMYLDIDCVIDTKQALKNWGFSMQYFFTYFAENESVESKFEMMKFALKGNLQDWWEGINSITKNLIRENVKLKLARSIEEGVDTFIYYIADEFLGENWIEHKEKSLILEKREALMNIHNLTICKMCYINEYTCEFQKYYYKYFDSGIETSWIKDLYFFKLPPPWNRYFNNEYDQYISQAEIMEGKHDTLGTRIKFLKKRIEELCYQRKLLEKSNKSGMALCCDKTNLPTQWGCTEKMYKKNKRRSNKFKRKAIRKYKRFNKRKIRPQRKYYKRKYKKNYNKEDKKEKIKPKKMTPKSKCECWNCGEKGHLSYECDKKKVRILLEDFEEIESEFSEVSFESKSELSDIYEIEEESIETTTSNTEEE